MNTDDATLYLLQTGLTGPVRQIRARRTSRSSRPRRTEYTLDGATELRVPLKWTDGNGVTVTKTFIFKPGEYRIDLEYDIDNQSATAWQAAPYAQIQRRDPVQKRSIFTTNVENLSFHGPAHRDGTKYRKLKVTSDDDRNLSVDVTTGGWIAGPSAPFRQRRRAAGWQAVSLLAEGGRHRVRAHRRRPDDVRRGRAEGLVQPNACSSVRSCRSSSMTRARSSTASPITACSPCSRSRCSSC